MLMSPHFILPQHHLLFPPLCHVFPFISLSLFSLFVFSVVDVVFVVVIVVLVVVVSAPLFSIFLFSFHHLSLIHPGDAKKRPLNTKLIREGFPL